MDVVKHVATAVEGQEERGMGREEVLLLQDLLRKERGEEKGKREKGRRKGEEKKERGREERFSALKKPQARSFNGILGP